MPGLLTGVIFPPDDGPIYISNLGNALGVSFSKLAVKNNLLGRANHVQTNAIPTLAPPLATAQTTQKWRLNFLYFSRSMIVPALCRSWNREDPLRWCRRRIMGVGC